MRKQKLFHRFTNKGFEGELDKEFINKVLFDNISKDAVSDLESPTYDNLMKVSIMHSDAVVAGL